MTLSPDLINIAEHIKTIISGIICVPEKSVVTVIPVIYQNIVLIRISVFIFDVFICYSNLRTEHLVGLICFCTVDLLLTDLTAADNQILFSCLQFRCRNKQMDIRRIHGCLMSALGICCRIIFYSPLFHLIIKRYFFAFVIQHIIAFRIHLISRIVAGKRSFPVVFCCQSQTVDHLIIQVQIQCDRIRAVILGISCPCFFHGNAFHLSAVICILRIKIRKRFRHFLCFYIITDRQRHKSFHLAVKLFLDLF